MKVKVTIVDKSRNKSKQTPFVRDINLLDYIQVVAKRWWLIGLIVIITTSLGYYYSQLNSVSLYQSETRILISSEDGNMKTLMVMIKDPIIMNSVINELGLEKSPGGLAGQINVTQMDESRVIQILVTDTDPVLAAAIANATAASFKEEIYSIIAFEGVQLLSAAVPNPMPINETQNRSVILAGGFGLLVGVGLAFFLDSLDGTVRKEKEVEEILGVPVIGTIADLNKKKLLTQKKRVSEIKMRGDIVDLPQKKASSDR